MIEVKSLCKNYGPHKAVDNISFTIDKGHVYGLLGPNGAGKSTTMNIITGCLAASSGEVKIGGYDIFEEEKEAKRRIGYLPENPPVYQDMTVWEYLDFVAEAKQVSKALRKEQIETAMAETAVTDVSGRLIKHLSKGYRQRVGIAQALIGNPDVIILDEPTVGLDPRQIIEIRELIHSLGEKHTVILSSHILSEVRSVCDRILIISKGKLVAGDTPENLERLFAGTASVELTVKASEDEVQSILKNLTDITQSWCKSNDDGSTEVTVEAEGNRDIREDLFYAFAAAGKAIIRMERKHASLEDIFLELTAEEVKKDESHSEEGV